MSEPAHLEELSEEECLALLASVEVGRVGISSDALPAILPVNFVLHDRNILFRTVPGTKLQAAVTGTVVAFQADRVDYDGSGFAGAWSVLVRGLAQEITDPMQKKRADQLVPGTWAGDQRADHFVRIPIVVLTGRRIGKRDR